MSNIQAQAQKFGFIGAGHAGSRFVDTLLAISDKFYPAVCFNSAASDLRELDIVPLNNRVHIQLPDGVDGAGKDPKLGRQAVLSNESKVRDKITQEFPNISMIYLVFSSGGGTGRGAAKEIMRILDELGYSFGVIMIEPFDNEGYQPTVNNFTAFKEISEGYNEFSNFKGATLLDNQKLVELESFKHLSIEDFYIQANKLIAQSFHLFNLSTTKKGVENFDSRDYLKCLNAKGFMTLGTLSFNKNEIQSKSIFIDKLKENIEKNLFAHGLDITSATHAALILFIPKNLLDNIDREVLFAPFDEMNKILDGATVYKGIYPSKGDQVRLYTLISGMDFPREKIKETGSFAKELHAKTKQKVQRLKKTDDLFGDMDFDLDSDDDLDLDLNSDNDSGLDTFDFDL